MMLITQLLQALQPNVVHYSSNTQTWTNSSHQFVALATSQTHFLNDLCIWFATNDTETCDFTESIQTCLYILDINDSLIQSWWIIYDVNTDQLDRTSGLFRFCMICLSESLPAKYLVQPRFKYCKRKKNPHKQLYYRISSIQCDCITQLSDRCCIKCASVTSSGHTWNPGCCQWVVGSSFDVFRVVRLFSDVGDWPGNCLGSPDAVSSWCPQMLQRRACRRCDSSSPRCSACKSSTSPTSNGKQIRPRRRSGKKTKRINHHWIHGATHGKTKPQKFNSLSPSH